MSVNCIPSFTDELLSDLMSRFGKAGKLNY